jgi:flagellar protein FliO/FliZ
MQFLALNSRLESLVQLLTVLVVFIFVLAITYFGTRWVGNLQKEKMIGSNVKVLETMRISNSKYIQIIKVGTKCFTIAVCKDNITYLTEVNEDELFFEEKATGVDSESFKAILDKFKKDKPHND